MQMRSGTVANFSRETNVHTCGAFVYRIDEREIMDGRYIHVISCMTCKYLEK